MRPFTLGVTTLVHGFFAMVWVALVLDVGSPSFNLSMPQWGATEAVVYVALLFTASAALGVVVHTISRGVFHRFKERWAMEVLVSATVQKRFTAFGDVETFPSGPSFAEVLKAEGLDRVRKAGGFLQALEYQLLSRAPEVWRGIQPGRDQYRLARGFILTSAAFAPILPLWAPVVALDSLGAIGPLPIVRTQLFLLSVLASAVCYIAFRERTFRYAAATLLAYATVEGERKKGSAR
ncbi:MAG TPA: hypothetical protein VH833_06515 [Gemmatimonadales bacterium]|jgi:hypothetical protein